MSPSSSLNELWPSYRKIHSPRRIGQTLCYNACGSQTGVFQRLFYLIEIQPTSYFTFPTLRNKQTTSNSLQKGSPAHDISVLAYFNGVFVYAILNPGSNMYCFQVNNHGIVTYTLALDSDVWPNISISIILERYDCLDWCGCSYVILPRQRDSVRLAIPWPCLSVARSRLLGVESSAWELETSTLPVVVKSGFGSDLIFGSDPLWYGE